jgi:hypothetical protein
VPFKPDGSGQPYGPRDFIIGATVYLFGHPFTIVDANAETRALMASRYGIELGPGLVAPALGNTGVVPRTIGHEPHLNKVVCDSGYEEDTRKGFYRKAGDTKGKFLEHGSAQLRFECEWRETSEPFGDRRRFALQYYLADDTLEILDKSSAHSRGGQFSKFVSRQRLPRLPLEAGTEGTVPISALVGLGGRTAPDGTPLPDVEEVVAMAKTASARHSYSTGPTVWGRYTSPITGDPIFTPTTGKLPGGARAEAGRMPGPIALGGFPVTTSLNLTPDYVTAGDLVCGAIISVFGRPLLIKTCDPYTVAFGMHRLGVDQRRGFISDKTSVAVERAAAAPRSVPRGPVGLLPFTGVLALGSEEETRVNATMITPTYRAAGNFDKFMQLGGKVLRFEASLDPETCDPDDARREFVVSFFLEDDSLAIVEVLRDRKGATAVRWLSRGKHRNALGAPDAAATAAVKGSLGPNPLPGAEQAAYDRLFHAPGEKFGYGDSFGGQGYSGGIYGKADRVGPGGTGVAAAADLGIRDSQTHAFVPPTPPFNENDFAPGAILRLAHAPGQTFILGKPDGFTASFLAAKSAQDAQDARDVYVPDNDTPVPALPYENLPDAAPAPGFPPMTDELTRDCLTLAKVLAGVHASVSAVLRQADKGTRGYAPAGLVAQALARYGAVAPAIPYGVVDRVIAAFTLGTGGQLVAAAQAEENSHAIKHARFRSTLPLQPVPGSSPKRFSPFGTQQLSSGAGAVGTENDPMTGPWLSDFGNSKVFASTPMVDYPSLMRALKAVAERQGTLQPRLDKLLPQLRMALLSSRSHLRRVFRDLDTANTGAITFKEFRALLGRHHMDVGLNDAQIRAVMARFPPAEPAAAAAAGAGASEPCISWRGFIESILDAQTLAPGELEGFLDFVRGMRDTAPDGVGGTRTWPEVRVQRHGALPLVLSLSHTPHPPTPQVFPHVNAVSSWGADMDLRPFGIPSAGPSGGASSTRPLDATLAASRRAVAKGVDPLTAIAPQPSFHAPRAPIAPPAFPIETEVQAMGSTAHSYMQASREMGHSGRAAYAPPVPPVHHVPALSLPEYMAAGKGPSHALPVGAAPGMPGAAPRAPPPGSTDPRFPPSTPCLDVVDALSGDLTGSAVLARMRSVFGTRRLELYRSLALYDTGRRRVLDVPAFLSALQSAGLKMSAGQSAELQRMLLSRAAEGGPASALPYPHDVTVDYASFLDDLYGTGGR